MGGPGMVGQRSEAFYIDLDGSGDGTVQFTARKAGVITTVTKVTIEMGITSSGTVSLYKNGGFLSSMPVAPRMQASGDQPLYCSEYLTVTIDNGPQNQTGVKITFFWTEASE